MLYQRDKKALTITVTRCLSSTYYHILYYFKTCCSTYHWELRAQNIIIGNPVQYRIPFALFFSFAIPCIQCSKTPCIQCSKTPCIQCSKTPCIQCSKTPCTKCSKTPFIQRPKTSYTVLLNPVCRVFQNTPCTPCIQCSRTLYTGCRVLQNPVYRVFYNTLYKKNED